MLIEDKLALSERNNQSICFIWGPVFCELFNESVYIATRFLGLNLKINVANVKKLNGRAVVRTGFPLASMQKRFPQATATAWGFELKGEWDMSGYGQWFAGHVAQATCLTNRSTKPAVDQGDLLLANRPRPADEAPSIGASVCLTPQQIAFLATWEKGKYPAGVDIGFIESLKEHMLTFNAE
ncbi:hypothetical protein RCS94_08285 [Orbaceae bacterium ac157xtp]